MENVLQSLPAEDGERHPFRRLIIPREHGSWGLWLLPLLAGAAVGLARSGSAGNLFPAVWFLLAATFAFLAHQPLEALLGRSLIKPRTVRERNLALLWTIALLALAALALAWIVTLGYPLLLWLALAAACLFAIKLTFGNARSLRTTGQIVGAMGLTATATGGYYAITGSIDFTALLLWLASWLFAAAQIDYVQLRIHTANAHSLRQKLAAGWTVYLLHVALLLAASVAALYERIPVLLVVAFVPSALRLLAWTLATPQRLRVHRLGVMELLQGFLFNVLLAAAFVRFR